MIADDYVSSIAAYVSSDLNHASFFDLVIEQWLPLPSDSSAPSHRILQVIFLLLAYGTPPEH